MMYDDISDKFNADLAACHNVVITGQTTVDGRVVPISVMMNFKGSDKRVFWNFTIREGQNVVYLKRIQEALINRNWVQQTTVTGSMQYVEFVLLKTAK